MKKSLMKKIVNRCLEIINESIDDSKNPQEIKVYAIARTGLELSIPMKDVEYVIETYRRGGLNN